MTTPLYPGSGGFLAGTVRQRVSIGPDLAWLASEKYTVKRGGVTLKKAASTPAVDEVQSLASSGASAGTFILSFKGESTAALPYTATNAAVQTALRALTTIGGANVTVTGGPANTTALTFTFGGTLAGANQPLIGIDRAGLTGGATAIVSETTRGSQLGVAEVLQGTFLVPDAANAGYYKVAVSGDTIDDLANPISGYAMASVNVANGDVTVGLLIQGSVLKLRVQPTPVPTNIKNACAGRITFQ